MDWDAPFLALYERMFSFAIPPRGAPVGSYPFLQDLVTIMRQKISIPSSHGPGCKLGLKLGLGLILGLGLKLGLGF